MVISRFEEIESWQGARQLAVEIYGATRQGPFAKDFGLRDQIQRSCVSIMANIAEGFGRNGRVEFIRYLTVAQASAVEVQSHLYIALDLGYIAEPAFKSLYSQASTVRRQIGGFIQYLRSCRDRRQPETRNQKPETSPRISRSNQPLH
ncbi:MAG: four helix bundle protein [Bryobacteraceae bacterium]